MSLFYIVCTWKRKFQEFEYLWRKGCEGVIYATGLYFVDVLTKWKFQEARSVGLYFKGEESSVEIIFDQFLHIVEQHIYLVHSECCFRTSFNSLAAISK